MHKRMSSSLWLGLAMGAMLLAGIQVFCCRQANAQDQNNQDTPQGATQTPADQGKTHTGEFVGMGQGFFRMTTNGKNTHTHKVTDQTQVTINGQPAQLSDLKTGDQIRVTTGPNNVALKIAATRGQTPQRGQAGFRGGNSDDTNNANDKNANSNNANNNNANNQGTPWLGVLLQEKQAGQPGQNQPGVRVIRTYPSGPAARAGLFAGDQLVQIDDQQVNSPEDVAKIISSDQPNQQLNLVVLRGGEKQTLTATLADRSDFLPNNQPMQGQGNQNNQFDSHQDHFSNVPGHAMILEQQRHFAQQHQRIEQKLDQVLKELNQLKKQLGQGQGKGQ